MEWSADENNTLGLWLTRGGWHGYHHFAMEPANGARDSLAEAAAGQHCGAIEVGQTKTWTVHIKIGKA